MNNQKSLIMGMGKTGHSFAEYLAAREMSFDFADTREMPPSINEFKALYQDKTFHLGELNHDLLNQYQQILLSPGFDVRHPFLQAAKQKNLVVKGDIDLFISEMDSQIIGITGSNGKSTLTELMAYALNAMKVKVAVGGNIGTAALTLLNQDKKDVYVLELSSFQLDISADLALDIAIILNISEDHMDRYDSYEDYINSKLSIYDSAKIKVVNLDDSQCAGIVDGEIITFSLSDRKANAYFSEIENTFYIDGEAVIEADQFLLQGLHNYQNILAALAIAKSMKLDVKQFSQAATTYKGLPHRCELIQVIDGVAWINDSKATNVGAASAAINSLKQPLHVIMGGQAKGVDFTEFANAIPEHIKSIILLGEDALFIQSFMDKDLTTTVVSNMKEAVKLAQKNSVAGDTVLLSPACSSFDMYTGYEHRGHDFREIVMGLAA